MIFLGAFEEGKKKGWSREKDARLIRERNFLFWGVFRQLVGDTTAACRDR